MKFKTNLLDPVVMFCFVLWVAQMDFSQAVWHMWAIGGILIAYLIWYAIRLGWEKTQRKDSGKRKSSEL